MILEYEGKEPPSLEIFLDFVGLTKEEFYKIAESHTVSPWKFNSMMIELGKELPDFKDWAREGKMDRADVQKQIDKWLKFSTK